ncbi:MAG TPA: hypothetical protein VIK55_14370 [Paludibacter sp.]
MHPKLKPIVYGLGVFVVYAILVYALRYFSHSVPFDAKYLGIYTNKDLYTGLGIAVLMTYMHIQKTGRK